MKRTLAAAALAAFVMIVLAGTSQRPVQAAPPASVAAAPAPVERVFTSLLAAIKADDYAAFVTDAQPAFKAALTKPMLDEVNAQFAPRIKQGYKVVYLGQLSQHGYQVYLWKLSYTGGGDDSLASLSLKAGKVGGFFIN